MNLGKKIRTNEKFSEMILDEEIATDFISTGVVSLNLLFGGGFDRGIPRGKLSMFSAPSSLGKSLVALSTIRNFQKKVPNGFVILVDTEFAFEPSLGKKFNLDMDDKKFICIQETSIEDINHVLSSTLEGLTTQELLDVFIVIDSWGGFTSTKMIKDATEGNDIKDMTLTVKKNNLAILLNQYKCTRLVINHTYANIGGYGEKMSIPGGTKLFYLSQSVVMGNSKANDKETASATESSGAIITCICRKSRYGREKSNLKFRINYDTGLDLFFGLLDDALEGGFVLKPKAGSYTRAHIKDDTPVKENKIYTSDFWVPIFRDTDFKEYLSNRYSFVNSEFEVANTDIDFQNL